MGSEVEENYWNMNEREVVFLDDDEEELGHNLTVLQPSASRFKSHFSPGHEPSDLSRRNLDSSSSPQSHGSHSRHSGEYSQESSIDAGTRSKVASDSSPGSDVDLTTEEEFQEILRRKWEKAATEKKPANDLKRKQFKYHGIKPGSSHVLEKPCGLFLKRTGPLSGYDRSQRTLNQTKVSGERKEQSGSMADQETGVQSGENSDVEKKNQEIPTVAVRSTSGVPNQSGNVCSVMDLNLDASEGFGVDLNVPEIGKGVQAGRIASPIEGEFSGRCSEKYESNDEIGDGFFMGREKLRSSSEFKEAEEKEWTMRRAVIEREAEMARSDKRKKKLEESQQKRLLEFRTEQENKERTMSLKIHMQSEMQSRFRHLSEKCKDMASLLQSLNILEPAGSPRDEQQVKEAFRRATFKFHPDRMADFAKGNLWKEVEAEETFKLIQTFKGSKPWLVAPQPLFHGPNTINFMFR